MTERIPPHPDPLPRGGEGDAGFPAPVFKKNMFLCAGQNSGKNSCVLPKPLRFIIKRCAKKYKWASCLGISTKKRLLWPNLYPDLHIGFIRIYLEWGCTCILRHGFGHRPVKKAFRKEPAILSFGEARPASFSPCIHLSISYGWH